MITINKQTRWFVVYLFLLGLFVGLYIVTSYTTLNILFFLKVTCLFLPVVTIAYLKKTVRWFHSFILFSLSFTLFYFSRVYLDLLGIYNLQDISMYVWYIASEKVVVKSLIILVISFLSVSLGFFYNGIKNPLPKNTELINYRYRNIILFSLLLLLPGALMKMKYDFSFVSSFNYLEVYSSFQASPLPYRVSWFLFIMLFPLAIVYKESKNYIMILLIAYLLVSLGDALKGSRGVILKPVAFCIWYYYKFYAKGDIKLVNIIILILVVLSISQLFLIYRLGIDLSLEELALVVPLFFAQQGVTFTVLPLYFDYEQDISNPSSLYIFYPLTSTLIRFFANYGRDGHSYEYMNNSISLDHKLIYSINPEAYLQGSGIGSSYVLELYVFGGLFAVVICSFFIGRLIRVFEELVVAKPLFLLFGICWIEHLVWMNRGSFFPELFKLLVPICLYFVLSKMLMNNRKGLKFL